MSEDLVISNSIVSFHSLQFSYLHTHITEDRGKMFLYLRGHTEIPFYLDWGLTIQYPQLLPSAYTDKNLFITCLSYHDRSHLAWQLLLYLYIFCPMRHNLINKSFFPSFWAINLYYTSGTKDWSFYVENTFQLSCLWYIFIKFYTCNENKASSLLKLASILGSADFIKWFHDFLKLLLFLLWNCLLCWITFQYD